MSIICKEHPILFTGEMLKARDAGIKTMTRRIIKTKIPHFADKPFLRDSKLYFHYELNPLSIGPAIKCPYGKVGDRLSVKEDYKYSIQNGDILVDYRDKYNDTAIRLFCMSNLDQKTRDRLWAGKQNVWKSKLLMFKFMARRFDEITNIRVERLQDISEADAMYEGIGRHWDGHKYWYENYQGSCDFIGNNEGPMKSFKTLWNSINVKRGYPWESNPWVWVIEFKISK